MTMPNTEPLTDRSLKVARRFYQIARNYKATLGFADVWFGDQRLLPRTPSLCVEPGLVRRDLQAAQNRTLNDIDTIFLVYHSPVTEMQNARRDTIRIAEDFVHYLEMNHLRLFDRPTPSNPQGDQLTIHGHGIEIDPGFAVKQGTLYNAVQITWRSVTKTRLQQP